ncbi:hypothetical protein FDI24_gp040 [Acidovorax phage ACP17]|uniref:Uncharacterized protein n=1 Tax=Acidovorax phage ACP17 TaxID=2010329 RepID=A0A218M3E6_9CAUD|nr:hypothetical protein FDI24_gp040 [Acidovorax phage ACP17]ASD50573.1 hypothetical protein [Acidovorax phage ACP17]
MKTQKFQNGIEVKIDQGGGRFTTGIVRGFDGEKKNICGWVGNYQIEVTGGVNCFGKPAKVGAILTVLHTHVSEA